MKVLVVEDSGEKLKHLSAVLMSVVGMSLSDITAVGDSHQARMWLSKTQFDLLIVDIAIPNRVDEAPRKDGGIRLVEEVLQPNGRYRVPTHVIGVTAFPELFREATERFAARLLSVLYYDPQSTAWSDRLRARARQISAGAQQTVDEFESEVAIVCALDDPELRAVLRLPWGWLQEIIARDATIYNKGMFLRAGRECVAYAADSGRTGMTATAVLASKMIHHFKPRYLVMLGIAAGVPGRTRHGDVVAADPAWDWGAGKWMHTGTEVKFQAAPHQLDLDVGVRNRIRAIAKDQQKLVSVKQSWVADSPPHEFTLRVGPMASGAAVLADGATLNLILEQQRNLLAVEMEAYAVFAAASEAPAPRPTAIVLKGVVDFAGPDKDDSYQKYAAHTSVEVFRLLMDQL